MSNKFFLPTCNGFILSNFFTTDECSKMIKMCEKIGFKQLPETSLSSHRTNTRIELMQPTFAIDLFEKIKTHLPKSIKYEGKIWNLSGVNEKIRYCKYDCGQYFDKHIDGHLILEKNNQTYQSFYTLMIYLNDVPKNSGGKTRFYTHNGKQLVIDYEYQPQSGDCICFDQEKLHDGENTNKKKYIMRTEILYVN